MEIMDKRTSEAPVRKPYQAPKLTVYGDLTQLTMTVAMMGGNFDNMMLTKRT
jgi:hypothetical protein